MLHLATLGIALASMQGFYPPSQQKQNSQSFAIKKLEVVSPLYNTVTSQEP